MPFSPTSAKQFTALLGTKTSKGKWISVSAASTAVDWRPGAAYRYLIKARRIKSGAMSVAAEESKAYREFLEDYEMDMQARDAESSELSASVVSDALNDGRIRTVIKTKRRRLNTASLSKALIKVLSNGPIEIVAMAYPERKVATTFEAFVDGVVAGEEVLETE